MRGLVSGLLLLARADVPRERPHESIDLGEIIRAAAGEAAPLAAGHDLIVDAPDGLILEGGRDDLHRMVLNLIENAIRHTPPGTCVRVNAHRPDDGQIRVVVEDEGPGLPPEIRDRAFERFVRGAGDGGKGSGLGLAIVDAVAVGHGGRVEYEDRPAGGARFIVLLPAAPRSVGMGECAPSTSSTRPSSTTPPTPSPTARG
jgi:two-component system OmpR family sensor kinase